ncbi:MAG: nitroreductase family protein [Deltaproteobacteria bacterium]|nr:nitroreductase family protein [Deltaproteobacteria bacterium]MBW2218183.1 nitroreductase family protein [Deltaproteobacteria bacterium]
MLRDLIIKNRSCRRFYQDYAVDEDTLRSLVDLARNSASAANLQPLKYMLSCDPIKNKDIFSCLGWAAYLEDWKGPVEGERPPAYIVFLGDTTISPAFGWDTGIAAQSILLGAREKGLAGCMIGAIKRKRLTEVLYIEERFKIALVIAIGKPKEEAIIEEAEADSSIRYWRDDDGVHHVPKRKLGDIIIS